MHFMAIHLQLWQQAESLYTQAFEECLLMSFIPAPVKGKSKVMMHYEQIKKYNCAGFIFEPWLEAAGMVHEPEALAKLIKFVMKTKCYHS
jgi:hypothetical protein